MLPLLLVALQAVPAAPSPGHERVSILLPDCPASADAKQDVVVCGRRPEATARPNCVTHRPIVRCPRILA